MSEHALGCGALQEAQKRMKIKQLPTCLIFHLKRFKYIEQLNRCGATCSMWLVASWCSTTNMAAALFSINRHVRCSLQLD